MVILAVGLLGLEALGIGAARSNALAERQSGYATIAADSLESAMHRLRRSEWPSQFCQTDLRHGDRLSRRVVTNLPDPVTGNPRLAIVTVTVIPNPESPNAPSSDFEITSSLYLHPDVPISGSLSGQPCV